MTIQHFSEKELATRWRMSEETLQQWRIHGIGPLYLKIGGRVLYRIQDIEEFENNSVHQGTSEPLSQGGE